MAVGWNGESLFEREWARCLVTVFGQQSEALRGLYAGNPKRATTRPTAERLLKAFDNLTLYRLADSDDIWYEVSPLSDLQERILDLVGIPDSTYTDLTNPLLDDT